MSFKILEHKTWAITITEEEMEIQYHRLSLDEIDKASEQITISYTSAYKGLMDDSYLASLSKHHWSPILQNSIHNGDICMAATCNNTMIGSTVFSIINAEKEKYAEWHAFYLLPQYIGHGIGHSFYQIIEKEMLDQGCLQCILEVLSSNERAVQFYLSHGFSKTETFVVEEYGMTLSCDKMVKKFR